jgi:DUF4097 and DUF4098 domain-containing protein YvlB
MKHTWTILLGSLIIIVFFNVPAGAQVVSGDVDDVVREIEEELDESSQEMAEDYLDILEELQEIVEDYTEYFADAEPEIQKTHPISFERFTEGLKSGAYAESYELLLKDIEAFIEELKDIEREHQGGVGMVNGSCCRLVRNLRRELSILVDVIEDYAERVKTKRQFTSEIQVYLKEAMKKLAVVIKQHKEIEKSVSELNPRVPRVTVPETPDVPSRFPHVSPPAFGQKGEVGLRRVFSDSMQVQRSDWPVVISNPIGDIHIVGSDEAMLYATLEVEIKAPTRSAEKEFVSGADLLFSSDKSSYEIVAQLPQIEDPETKILRSVLFVQMPSTNSVEAQNAFGKTTAEELKAELTLNGEYVELEAYDIAGPVSVNNSFGSIKLAGINGNIVARNGYGPISVIDSRGEMELSNQYERITLSNSLGSVDIDNTGNTVVRNHRGDVTINNSYGIVAVDDLEGNLIANNAYQSLHIQGVAGWARVENSFANISVDGIDGNLRVVNKFGNIQAEDLQGPLEVISENGVVKLSLDRQLGGTSNISVLNGTLNLSLLDDSDVHMIAKATGGDITTFIPVNITRDGGVTRAEYTFGRGTDSLDISGSNSAIVITASK